MVRGRVVLPKVDQLPPSEEDVQELLHRFEEAVFLGEPFNFATFKRLWKEMTFSFIFEVRDPYSGLSPFDLRPCNAPSRLPC